MYGAFKHPEEDITHDANINTQTLSSLHLQNSKVYNNRANTNVK